MKPPPPSIAFTVPGVPVPLARPRMGRGGRVYTPEPSQQYKQRIALVANMHAYKHGWVRTDKAARYRVHVETYRAAERGDCDNFLKAVLDGLNGVLWPDDRQVHDARVVIRVDRQNPRTVVSVTVLEAGG